MQKTLSVELLKGVAPYAKLLVLQGIVENQDILNVYDIAPGPRRQMFLAQLAHESAGFRTTREYADGSAYEGRKDLGNVQEGDGKKFRGRGLIQLTGRANYRRFGDILGLDLENDPETVEDFPLALEVSALYWDVHKLNIFADDHNFEEITRRINGGYNGLEDRKKYLQKAIDIGL